MKDVFAVVMAGGSGTRFWPRSRRDRPKQSLSFAGDGTLIQDTMTRIPPEIPASRRLLVTLDMQADLLCRQTGVPEGNVLREPFGRDTAPCIALAAAEVARRDPDGIMVVLAADHVIHAIDRFRAVLRAAVEEARAADVIVTIGITPTEASTGFGYIERGEALNMKTFEVLKFHEKPNAEKAAEFYRSGRFFWNSGIFIWKARVIQEAIAAHLPEVAAAIEHARLSLGKPEQPRAIAEAYQSIAKGVSIDKGVLEHVSNRRVIAADFDWDDVGSLAALARHNRGDEHGNTLLGDVVVLDTRNCIIDNRDPGLVATLGVDDLIIVRTGDAVLVTRRTRAEGVKEIVEELRRRGFDGFL